MHEDRRRIIDDKLSVHFFTFSVYRRRKLLDHDHPKRVVLGVFNQLFERMSASCPGFGIMPDHIPALVWLPETKQLSKLMHQWKRQSSLNQPRIEKILFDKF